MLGLFAPILITGNIFLLEFWKECKDRDALPHFCEVDRKFRYYVENTKSLCDIRIPRPVYDGV